MAPHTERKQASPPLPPRVTRRGPAAAMPTPAKPWRAGQDSLAEMTQGKKPGRPSPVAFVSEPMETQLPLFPAEGIALWELEEPTRTLEDVGRGMAHKLRSGLCALNGGLQLSLQQMLPGPTREMLALAERGAHHITEIVKDLVLLTQRPAFHPRPLDINLLLSEFLNGLRHQPEWEGVTVTQRLDGSLPMILGDPDILDTVFDAVTKNASDAMRPRIHAPLENAIAAGTASDPLPRQLVVETSREGDRVVIRMTDTGAGLTAETMDLAFQPYFSTKSGRRGMGLPLARWLVHVHGGSMCLHSQPPTGTTVTFQFPDPTCSAELPRLTRGHRRQRREANHPTLPDEKPRLTEIFRLNPDVAVSH
jgi:signal transduction histidine kinase